MFWVLENEREQADLQIGKQERKNVSNITTETRKQRRSRKSGWLKVKQYLDARTDRRYVNSMPLQTRNIFTHFQSWHRHIEVGSVATEAICGTGEIDMSVSYTLGERCAYTTKATNRTYSLRWRTPFIRMMRNIPGRHFI